MLSLIESWFHAQIIASTLLLFLPVQGQAFQLLKLEKILKYSNRVVITLNFNKKVMMEHSVKCIYFYNYTAWPKPYMFIIFLLLSCTFQKF